MRSSWERWERTGRTCSECRVDAAGWVVLCLFDQGYLAGYERGFADGSQRGVAVSSIRAVPGVVREN